MRPILSGIVSWFRSLIVSKKSIISSVVDEVSLPASSSPSAKLMLGRDTWVQVPVVAELPDSPLANIMERPVPAADPEPEVASVAKPEVVLAPVAAVEAEVASVAAVEPELAPVAEPEVAATAEPEVAPVAEPEVAAAVEPELAPVAEPELAATAEPEVVAATAEDAPLRPASVDFDVFSMFDTDAAKSSMTE